MKVIRVTRKATQECKRTDREHMGHPIERSGAGWSTDVDDYIHKTVKSAKNAIEKAIGYEARIPNSKKAIVVLDGIRWVEKY